MSTDAKKILEAINKDPELARKLYEALRDRFATREEFQRVLEEIQKSRGEANQRFEAMQNQLHRMERKLDNITASLGLNFEGYNKRVLEHFLSAQGIPADKMAWRVHFPDPKGELNPETLAQLLSE